MFLCFPSVPYWSLSVRMWEQFPEAQPCGGTHSRGGGEIGSWLLFLHQICKVDMQALQNRDGSQQKKELSKHDQKPSTPSSQACSGLIRPFGADVCLTMAMPWCFLDLLFSPGFPLFASILLEVQCLTLDSAPR